ncbi:DUF6293 family protein [Promethearchaeum syntrophicum]|uniref:DUF6293 family protein n=1 Tax=Promethearchaeum syntrophicum TaxID=2594042 RepID=A0A5B9D644_9ARCH|nr:DUF6293 family protein [Candidatus Prometheoarchaeum syntrophicum]QEE14463.1 hypothetical protein DSAG12_00276 [Candidatus Prometheoarchaeum syntrophicum]
MRKIHITYNAQEKKRITEPILSSKPDVLYYICHQGEIEDIFLNYKKMNLETIKNNLENCIIIENFVDYVNYYDIIGNLAKIISSENAKSTEEDISFTINMGTGSKMVAVANLDAGRLWDNIKLIYPYSLDYNPNEESTHSGILISAEPPKFKFEKPPLDLIKAMQILYWLMKHDKFDRERDFVLQRDWQEAIYRTYKIRSVKKNINPRKQDSSEKISILRRFIGPLTDKWGFIYRKKQGRDYKVFFTDAGIKIVLVFMNYDYGINFHTK